MGAFSNMNNDVIISPEIDRFLKDSGYEADDGEWVKTYESKSGLYYTWVKIDILRIEFYKEYDCGGMVDKSLTPIRNENTKDLNSFIKFLDEEFNCFNFS